MNDTCEIQQLKLTNGSAETKELSVFSYVEWCLWNADDDMKNFQRNFSTGEVEVVGSTISTRPSTENVVTTTVSTLSTLILPALIQTESPSLVPTEALMIRRQ